jgi:hypothetical protein
MGATKVTRNHTPIFPFVSSITMKQRCCMLCELSNEYLSTLLACNTIIENRNNRSPSKAYTAKVEIFTRLEFRE